MKYIIVFIASGVIGRVIARVANASLGASPHAANLIWLASTAVLFLVGAFVLRQPKEQEPKLDDGRHKIVPLDDDEFKWDDNK